MKSITNLLLVCCASIATQTNAALVSRYQFAGNATDSVGGKNLTQTGTTGSGVNYATATINSTLLNTVTFVGNNDGSSNATRYLSTTAFSGASNDSITVSFWANGATMTSSFNDMVGVSTAGNVGFKFETTTGTASDPVVVYGGASGSIAGLTANTTIGSEGAWHHYAATMSSTASAFYIDGVQIGSSGAGPGTVGGITKLFVGTGFDNLTRGWNGSVADLQIYDTPLTVGEVSTLFNNPGTVIPEPTSTSAILALGLLSISVRRKRH